MILMIRGDSTSARVARICGSCCRKKRCPCRTGTPCSKRKPRIPPIHTIPSIRISRASLVAANDVCEFCAGSSGGLLPPSPPAEKATARQDQAGQSSTDDRVCGTATTPLNRPFRDGRHILNRPFRDDHHIRPSHCPACWVIGATTEGGSHECHSAR
jgi:hypothetical protein